MFEPPKEHEIQFEPLNNPSQVEGYEKIKEEARVEYSKYKQVKCPALGNDPVYFLSEGFNHLIYKRAKKPRDQRIQVMRFKLLPKAKELIEVSTTFQEYEESYEYMVVNRYGKSLKENMLVKSWGLIGIMGSKFRIKVVIQQIGNGKKEFYSVIPAWTTRYYKDIKIIEVSRGSLTNEDEEQELKSTTQENSGAL